MIKHKWQELSERERKLLMVTGVIILFYLVSTMFFSKGKISNSGGKYGVFNIMQPNIRAKVEGNTKIFLELQPKITKLKQLQKQVPNHQKLPDNSLLDFIKSNIVTLNSANSEQPLIESQQDGKMVLIKYQDVVFDSLIQWLQKTRRQYGLIVISAKIEPVAGKQGYVSAEILLRV